MEFDGFDWTLGNREKCQTHGVSVREIEELFSDIVKIFPDSSHSVAEQRFIAIGKTTERRMVFLVFSWRRTGGLSLLRPISARYMHAKEIRRYDEDVADLEDRQ